MELQNLKKLAINLLDYYKESKDMLAYKEALRLIMDEIRPKENLKNFWEAI